MKTEGTISTYEFFQQFPDEQAAVAYLESRRWPNGIACTYCGSVRTSRQKDYRYHQCKDCRKKFTVRVGTIFERSHIPLDKWLYAMYLLETARKGISSLQLSKELGITQKATWFMLHRLREACDIEAEPMIGQVEVDESYFGGKEANKHESKKLKAGRGTVGKSAVMGMRERETGEVRAFPIADTRRVTFEKQVTANVARGATVYTDEHSSYRNLGEWYEHQTVAHSVKEFVNGMASTNGIESVWAVLKRGYNGVYHQWTPKHMARYINEFVFRLNEGNVRLHTMRRIESLIDGAIGKRLTYADLTGE